MQILIKARELIDTLNLSLPIVLSDITDYLGYTVRYSNLSRIDAMFFRDNGGKSVIIFVNDVNRSPKRVRFSLAHEIGHAYLKHAPLSFSSEAHAATSNNVQEVQANKFAAELLMPKKQLVRYGFLSPEQISELCNVSIGAATIRAQKMGWLK